jgi:hypothetical protein
MATYQNGIMGTFSGNIGTVTGASWKKKPYMRSKSRKTRKKASPAQLAVRAKFKLLGSFIASIGGFINITFKDDCIPATARNMAFTCNHIHAVTGDYPDLYLDFSQVLVSRGSLHNANNCKITPGINGSVIFEWTDNSGGPLANPDDRAILLIYCPEMKSSVYTMQGAARSNGRDIFHVPGFTGKTIHTWMAFISSDKKYIASSIYTGEIMVE